MTAVVIDILNATGAARAGLAAVDRLAHPLPEAVVGVGGAQPGVGCLDQPIARAIGAGDAVAVVKRIADLVVLTSVGADLQQTVAVGVDAVAERGAGVGLTGAIAGGVVVPEQIGAGDRALAG